MDLVDLKTGAVTQVPDDQAQRAILSGTHTFIKGSAVPIRTERGDVKQVSAEEAMAHVTEGTAHITSPEAYHQAEIQRKYGGVGGTAAAFGTGLARGASLGLSDPAAIAAARALGGDEAAETTRQHLEGWKEASPYAEGAGQLVGMAAPLLASGGAAAAGEAAEGASAVGTAVRGAGAIPRAVSALGEVGGGVAKRIVGDAAESFAGRMAQKTIAHAATGAVEGAAYGAGNEISENSLNGGNHELTAEQLIAAAGHGALVGGVLGGGIGAGGEMASTGLDAVSEKLLAPVKAAEGEAAKPGGIRGFLEDLANDKAHRATGAMLKDSRYAAERIEGGTDAIGKFVRDDVTKAAGKPLESMDLYDMQTAAQKLKGQAVERMDGAIEKMDALPDEGRVKALDVTSKLRQIGENIRGKLGHEPLANQVESLVQDFEDKAGIKRVTDPTLQAAVDQQVNSKITLSYSKLRDLRKDLDELINKGKKNPLVSSPIQHEMTQMRWTLENALTDNLESHAADAGVDLGKEYRAAKAQYQKASYIDHTSTDKIARQENTNASFGLRDAIMAAGGLAMGHPLAAAAAGMGMKLARERGNQIVAGMADRLLHLGAVERATQGVTQQIGGSLRAYLSRATEVLPAMPIASKLAMGPRKGRSLEDGYNRTVSEVQEAAADPAAHMNRIGLNVGTLGDHAPQVSLAVGQKAAQVTTYLASKIPKQQDGPSLLQPQIKGPPPSEMQMSAFMRTAAVLKKPLSLLGELRGGRITQDEVDAVRVNYPQLYGQMQKAAMESIASRPTAVPYEKRKHLATLLGVPTDPTLTGDFVKQIQDSYQHTPDAGAQQQAEENPTRGKPKKGSLPSFASQTATQFERA